jgi:hypothetical protein
MVITEDCEAYPWDRRCSMCGNKLHGPIAVWPVYHEGRKTASPACICERCCKSAAARVAKDLQIILEIKEIESMGFDDAVLGRRWGSTLFVPGIITNH